MSENTAYKSLRLDLAVAKQLNVSRTIAGDIIEKGHVKVNGKTVEKVGAKIANDSEIEIEGGITTFVSRGGFKLQAALEEFSIDLAGLVCMDVGASTGGFTDCMLKNGAKRVYALDCGTNQLRDELRKNTAVISMENTDIRDMTQCSVPPIDFASVDVSFISLEKILGRVYDLMAENSVGVLLIKPEFEAGPGAVNKKGVIKSAKVALKAVENVYSYAKTAGFICKGHIESPIKGGSGNREFLMYIIKEIVK